MAPGPITSWQIEGEKWKQWQILFSWALKSLWMVTAAMKLKDSCSLEGKLWLTVCIKKQRHHFANKGPYSQSYGFSSGCVRIWKMDRKESQALKNWCFRTVVLEKTLESPLDCKEIKSLNLKDNQPWISLGRTDAEIKAPILWPLDAKIPMLGKIEGKKRRKRQRMRWLYSITD